MTRKYNYISACNRFTIETLYRNGHRVADIALQIGVHPTTLYRELKRGYINDTYDKPVYSAILAQNVLRENIKRRYQKRTNTPDSNQVNTK